MLLMGSYHPACDENPTPKNSRNKPANINKYER